MDYEMEDLVPIVAELALKCTGFEHTSITYERAQEFMLAVLHCLREYNDCQSDTPVRKDISVKEQYQIGRRLLKEKVLAGQCDYDIEENICKIVCGL